MGAYPARSEDLLQPKGFQQDAQPSPLFLWWEQREQQNVLTVSTCDPTCQHRLSSRVSTPDSPVPPWVNVPMLEDHRLSCLRVHFHETQV